MDLLPTSEQQQIIDSASAFIGDKLPMQRLKLLKRTPEVPTEETWRSIAELGWFGLGVDPSAGGVGYGPSEEILLFREMGRAVVAPRLLFTVIAAHAATAAGDNSLAERIIGGEVSAALAVRNVPQTDGTPATGCRLYESSGAQVALMVDGDDVTLFDLSGAAQDARPCMDTALSMAVIEIDQMPVIAQLRDARIGMRGALLLAAYQVGLAERATAMIVDYAKIRQTFGRFIGAYQAVRHPCAEMAVRAEEARAQLFLASVAVADAMPDAPLQVAAARVLAEHAALQNSDDNIQLHGGIGVTEEFDAHFLMKRATVALQWFGDVRSHLDLVLNAPINVEGVS